jgi:hypothetical protein
MNNSAPKKNKAARGRHMKEHVKYSAIHMWVASKLGRPQKCEKCGGTDRSPRSYQWANISGKYERDLKDWVRLCKPCHMKFDNVAETMKTFQLLPENRKRNSERMKKKWQDPIYRKKVLLTVRRGENNRQAKLTDKAVREIRKNYIYHHRKYGYKGLSIKYGVSPAVVEHVIKRHTWKHVK